MVELTKLEKAVVAIYEEYTRKFPQQAQTQENLAKKASLDFRNLPNLVGMNVLEVGPGGGQLAKLMSSSGASVALLDLVATYLDQLTEISTQSFVADIQAPLKYRPAPQQESFDLITMCDVLEHVVRPGDALHSARQLLKPGGYLYVRSPSWETLAKYALANECVAEMAHLRTYTPEILLRELRDAGLHVWKYGTLRTHSEPRLILLKLEESPRLGRRAKQILHSIRHGFPVRGIPVVVIRLAQRVFTRPGEVWVLAQK